MKEINCSNRCGCEGSCQKHFNFHPSCDDGKDFLNPFWGLLFIGGLVVGMLFTRSYAYQYGRCPTYYPTFGPY